MTLLVIAFLSGVLTVLAPCVLPLLPIILWASAEDGNNKKIPLVIIGSLSVSILIFSILLKASTVLIWVPPSFWKAFSGGLIIGLGIITIFPNLWKNVSNKLGFSWSSNQLLQKSSDKTWMTKYIFMGFALGPVFSSCSPTYALILAIILPAGFVFGTVALISYILGLAFILLLIAIFGQRIIKNLKWASDPSGMFKKILGVVFVLVGLAIISGYDKKIEAAILDAGFLNTTNFEQNIIDELKLDEVEPQASVKKKSELSVELSGQTCEDGTCDKDIEWSLNFIEPTHILEKGKLTNKWYMAPDLAWLENWINSEEISSLEELRGQVVMIDFWTLGCINCINTHNETQKLYEELKDEGFTILWLHAPEFQYEKNIEEVKKAVQEYGLTFPVAQDNDFTTWRMYNNKYWPAFYIIDKNGYVRYTHFWEGGYEKKREVVKKLLEEPIMVSQSEDKKKEFKFSREGLKTNTAESSIELGKILDGWPGKDGIPAINTPKFITQKQAAKSASYLWEDDLWIVLHRWDEARFYGYDVLVWHEIVNDEIAGEKVSVTFCPLCGSAIVYDRWDVNGREVNFGVSGKLYNSNLLMYDTHDETLWSQSLWEAVTGDQLGTRLNVVKSQLMNYIEFQEKFPDGVVLSNDTGYFRKYGEIPYGNYDTNEEIYFPAPWAVNTQFHPKKLFYIVNDNDNSLAFAWEDLREEGEASITIWEDIYTATFLDGLADVVKNDEILPWYFEMWFSWASHNEGNKNIWSK